MKRATALMIPRCRPLRGLNFYFAVSRSWGLRPGFMLTPASQAGSLYHNDIDISGAIKLRTFLPR